VSLRLRPPPDRLLDPNHRHLFVFAHQDDDLGYSGILHRFRHKADVVWMTNGDGLAPEAGMAPEEYAAMRTREASNALGILGYSPEHLHFLGHSEIEIYDDFKAIAEAGGKTHPDTALRVRVQHRMESIHRRLVERVSKADVVWTSSFQGGHPEHDLIHFLTAMAVRDERRKGRDILFMEMPEYELLIFVPLRFAPWEDGPVHVMELTKEELALKELAFAAYPSQGSIVQLYKKLITAYGRISALRLKPFTFRSFASLEYFRAVPLDRQYDRAPYRLDRMNYILEKHQGCRITFNRSVRPMVRLFLKGT